MPFNVKSSIYVLGLLGGLVFSSPIEPMSPQLQTLTKRMPALVNCNEEQTKRLEDVFEQLSSYALLPMTWFAGTAEGFPYDEKKKAFSHYFKPEDKDTVETAFKAFTHAIVVSNYYNIRCASGAEADCSGGGSASFAFAQPWPEDFEVPDHITPGQRQLVVCPLFWEDDRTKRDLPLSNNGKIKEFCDLKESKRFKDWETGAHTLLHEISHLDEFGKLAEFGELTTPASGDIPEYKSHGTDDWKNKGDPGNARTLRNSNARNRIPRTQNAESLAAFALELTVDKVCGVKDVSL